MFERLKNVVESFNSKVGDKFPGFVVDYGLSLIELDSKLQHLKRNSRTLSSVASDIETQIKKEELRGKKKRKREVEKWLEMVQGIERDFLTFENEIQDQGFIRGLLSGDRAAKLNATVERLIEQSQHFSGLVLEAYETRGEPLLTSKLSGETFERILRRIWECLVVDKVPIIGIYGMSGVGKTILAMHIHNRVLEQTEDHVYWVRVSQEFSIKKLQDDIAKVIGLTLSHDTDEEKRAAELNRALTQRKGFVLILDDVSEDINLERFGDPLRVDGCRLIITTRSLKVCRRIGCQENFEVKALDEDEAWNLFKETIGQETTLAPQVQEIAKSMVRNQGGLPQRIITLGRSMRGVTEIREWRNALAEVEEFLTREANDMEDENFRVPSNS
ncbi:hypothetical protein Pfo_020469 [Paulownia fortunei]|nr:hypothetical protein Pfo_020469 [Paulownia fortunei]